MYVQREKNFISCCGSYDVEIVEQQKKGQKSHQNDKSKETQSAHKDLHKTFIINVSSKAELGSLGLDPSHLSFVLSSDGIGKKVNVDITTLPFVEFVI